MNAVTTNDAQNVSHIVKAHAKNLETIKRAAKAGRLALLECQLVSTGETVAALVAISGGADGECDMVPFAVMLNGNPYTLLRPPNPEGGFYQEEPADPDPSRN